MENRIVIVEKPKGELILYKSSAGKRYRENIITSTRSFWPAILLDPNSTLNLSFCIIDNIYPLLWRGFKEASIVAF